MQSCIRCRLLALAVDFSMYWAFTVRLAHAVGAMYMYGIFGQPATWVWSSGGRAIA